MLFLVTWDSIDTSEESARRSLEVFSKWQPPAGVEFKGFYSYAEGNGGAAIIEATSAAALTRSMATFIPWLSFDSRAILPIEEWAAISGEAVAFRDSVG